MKIHGNRYLPAAGKVEKPTSALAKITTNYLAFDDASIEFNTPDARDNVCAPSSKIRERWAANVMTSFLPPVPSLLPLCIIVLLCVCSQVVKI